MEGDHTEVRYIQIHSFFLDLTSAFISYIVCIFYSPLHDHRLMRIVPGQAITFMTYEAVSSSLTKNGYFV